jgi:uncharacterized protein (TIGR03086 family)
MATTAEKFVLVNEGFRARLQGLSPEQLAAQTPCEGWTTSDCIDHVISIYLLVALAVDPSVTDLDGASAAARFDHVAPLLEQATASETLGSTIVESPFGPLALKQLISSVVLHDTLVHTWDIAVATGGDPVLDEDLVAGAFAKMAPLDEGLRGASTFGPKITAPEGADVQTQFLNFLGRTVR